MNHVVFLKEAHMRLLDVDQPSVMGETRLSGSLDSETRLGDSRGHFEVSGLANPDEFGADPEGITDVF